MFHKVLRKKAYFILFLISLFCAGIQAQDKLPEFCLSPITHQALGSLQEIDSELGCSGSTVSEFLLQASYFQDECLVFLQQAEGVDEYLQGMQQLKNSNFQNICKLSATFLCEHIDVRLRPPHQEIPITFQGQSVSGFLNTFKVNRHLTSQDRGVFFEQEQARYLRDHFVEPFILDESTITKLEAERVYNFVLLPSGLVRVAIERPGKKEYHVRDDALVEAFRYPNHTILAGHSQQAAVTAGSFIMYQSGTKRLFFVSCKSGHFQPSFESLTHMQTQLATLGVNPFTVICVPDVDLTYELFKLDSKTQVPICLTKQDREHLFYAAQNRWKNAYKTIDRQLLSSFAQGIDILTQPTIESLNKQREEAALVRSAHNLFSASHKAPIRLHNLVEHFGKLKDAIKHKITHRICSDALEMIHLMDKYEKRKVHTFIPAEDASFYNFLFENIAQMKKLISQPRLQVNDYHLLKKLSREFGALFLYMSDHAKWQNRGYFIYRTLSEAFFEVNEMMAEVHDAHVLKIMNGELDKTHDVSLVLSKKIALQLNKYLNHLEIEKQ